MLQIIAYSNNNMTDFFILFFLKEIYTTDWKFGTPQSKLAIIDIDSMTENKIAFFKNKNN